MRGIYKLTNTVNGKCYIGKSENIANRLRYHIKSLPKGINRNKHLQNAFDKYGTGNFTLEILEMFDDDRDINEREKYYIALYDSINREHGYNLTKGGRWW